MVVSEFVVAQRSLLVNVSLHLKVMKRFCATGFSRLIEEVMWEMFKLLLFNSRIALSLNFQPQIGFVLVQDL